MFIEILVVVLIINILAAVAIPTFLSRRGKASGSAAKSDIQNAQTIVKSQPTAAGGSYPTLDATLTARGRSSSDAPSLPGVSYYSAGGFGDTYTIHEQAQGDHPSYYGVTVNSGVASYWVDTAAPEVSNTTAGTVPTGSSVTGSWLS